MGAQLNSYESYLASSLAICALEAAKDSDMEDLIAAVAEGGVVDDDQVPNGRVGSGLGYHGPDRRQRGWHSSRCRSSVCEVLQQ